jgi:ribosomal protein L11 methyltransferase
MVSLQFECEEEQAEGLSAELWSQGAHGIQEDPLPGGRCRLRAWFDHPEGLLSAFAEHQPELKQEPEVDWEAVSRQAWQPFEVGERLYLAPEWDESCAPAGRVRLTIHPGLALGTGAHAATQLCLEAMERHLQPGDRLLDVGTGSGILLAGAHALGTQFAAGSDIDVDSVQIARENLARDAVPTRLFAGSVRALRDASFDAVVANINAATHRALAGEYARVARRLLILSGFHEDHSAGVAATLGVHGFECVDTLTREQWGCLVLFREDPF